nr:hypothetical protein Iba_chr14bCG0430 [Ipomoea batatas]GME09265.1 hypothetical protein Iba_scaffold8488CG0010 [Ipomoea batatas]
MLRASGSWSICKIGCRRLGSKLSEDCKRPHILNTCALRSIMLFCSAGFITRGPAALPLKIIVLIGPGMKLYDSIIEPRMTASVTRIASLVTKTLNSSPSGPNNNFRTGCKASLAEKSRSFLPWTSRFSSLFHLNFPSLKSNSMRASLRYGFGSVRSLLAKYGYDAASTLNLGSAYRAKPSKTVRDLRINA